VFFALWPDAGTRDALAQAAQRMHRAYHGRRTRDDSIHLTLTFIGDVSVDRLKVLTVPPFVVGMEPFTLILDRCGCWPRNGIGWMAPSSIPDELGRLVTEMEGWLRGVGFRIEERPYSPHVTLIRNAQCVLLPDKVLPIEWHVEDCVLVRSVLGPDGSRYETISRWPLRRVQI
jgi:2'-5' RNA ligase